MTKTEDKLWVVSAFQSDGDCCCCCAYIREYNLRIVGSNSK